MYTYIYIYIYIILHRIRVADAVPHELRARGLDRITYLITDSYNIYNLKYYIVNILICYIDSYINCV